MHRHVTVGLLVWALAADLGIATAAPPESGPPAERLLGEQAWPKEEQCVRRMKRAADELEARLPRLAGRWSVNHDSTMVELQMSLGGIVAMTYLDLETDRRVRTHPRKPTGAWKPERERSPFSLSERRNGAEQGAWIAYSKLTAKEANDFLAIVRPALDECVATFDPIYRIARWTPNHGRIWFELQPRF